MAKTAFATNNDLTKKVWEEKLFRDVIKESYFSKFQGESADSLVHVKTQLEKSKGDKITFGLRMRLSGAGVTGNATLEGNEEALTTYSDSVSLERYRHAVRDDGDLSRQRAMFEIDEESVSALKDWGSEKIDQLCFNALGIGTGSVAGDVPSKIFYKTGASTFLSTGTDTTAISAMNATNGKLTPTFISFLKTWAKTGGDRSYIPLRPVKVKGREYYILLVHPDVMFDLKTDSTFTQAMREAEIRGPENPLFSGATAIWDGVVIHEHENVEIFTNGGGASVPYAKCSFMGAQSLIWAWGKRPEIVEETFDFKEQHAYAWSMTCAVKSPEFNSKTFGSLGVYLARTDIAGA